MSDGLNNNNGGDKRRRLDDLFADEPFLSPTMKARVLCDKMREQEMAENASTPLFGNLADEPRVSIPVDADGMISLEDAAAFLRTSPPPMRVAPISNGAVMEPGIRLVFFRDQVLNGWLRRVGGRETR